MLSWVVLNFILVIYSNATQLTYSLIWLLVMARMVIWIRSVRPSVQKFSWNFLVFSGTPHGVRGPCGVVYDRARFFEKMFYPQNGENRPSPGFFECIGKFSFFSQFFIFLSIWSIMKVYIIVILVCLSKFHIWENSGSWDMAQNALGQSDCGIFQSIAGL